MVGIKTIKDNFSRVKNPDKEPVLIKEYIPRKNISGIREKPKDFLHTGKEMARYWR